MNHNADEQIVHGSFIGNCYVLNIQGEIDEDYLRRLYAETINTIAHNVDLKGTILDFSNISIFDSIIFDSFRKISKAISLMGKKVIWLGLKPGVVSALVDLDVESNDICIAVNLQHGLDLIHS
jgi:rsbT antagonist protein RsbS